MSDQYPSESPVGSRNEAFQDGIVGTGQSPMATSMQQNVDPMFHPDSVLDVYNNLLSGNGMGPEDAARRQFGTSKLRPTQNGMAPNTYEQSAPLQSTYMNV